MKKLASILLAGVLTLSMSITRFAQASTTTTTTSNKSTQAVSTTPIQLNDGETVKIPLKKSPIKTTGVSITAVLPDNGYIDFSRVGNTISYEVVIFDFFTNVIGTASITDQTSGLSAGFKTVLFPTGTIICNGFRGHYYVLTLQGTAYNLGIPVDTFWGQAGWTKQ